MRPILVICLVLLTIPAAADDIAPMALNSFTSAPPEIASATVFQQDGTTLGNVQGIDRAPGSIEGMKIGVAGSRIISLRANDVSYDAVKNVVVTDMAATKDALGQPQK
jgi:hypothetical protein